MNDFKFDITIIGGGASGVMSAIMAKRTNPELNVAIVESSFALGRKLLLSGAGRCNLTNANLGEKNFIEHYSSDDLQAVSNVFNTFGYKQIREFFTDLGIDLFEETKNSLGKVFPVSESARNVIKILTHQLEKLDVQVFLNTLCTDITKTGNEFKIDITREGKKQVISSKKIILTTGGMSYPILGSNGTGYGFAEKLGHTLIKCIPVGVPLLSSDKFVKLASGVKLRVDLQSIVNDELAQELTDDILFTPFGVSGSGILRLSSLISREFSRKNNSKVLLKINFLPTISKEQIIEKLEKLQSERLWIMLLGILPQKLVETILTDSQIESEVQISDLTLEQRKKLLDSLYDKTIQITGTKGWTEAEFTSGGISIKEIDENRMESKFEQGLYFAGEVVNVDGEIGGYNLSWAWASGAIAGIQSAS